MPDIRKKLNRFRRVLKERLCNGGQASEMGKLFENAQVLSISRQQRESSRATWWDDYLDKIVVEFNQSPYAFLRQPTLQMALHSIEKSLSRKYIEEMRNDSYAATELLGRLNEVAFGNPVMSDAFPYASHQTIQHAYYLYKIASVFEKSVTDGAFNMIVDLGGGYGNFCRLSLTNGHTGSYHIVDFPEMHEIQKIFLSFSLTKQQKGRVTYGDLKHLETVDVPSNSLLIATFSLSEMPMENRLQIERSLTDFDHIFFAYNTAFDGVDNIAYFLKVEKLLRQNGYSILHSKDAHRRAWFLAASRHKTEKS